MVNTKLCAEIIHFSRHKSTGIQQFADTLKLI